MKLWLVVKDTRTGDYIHEIDVSGRSERMVEKIVDGMSINMRDECCVVWLDAKERAIAKRSRHWRVGGAA